MLTKVRLKNSANSRKESKIIYLYGLVVKAPFAVEVYELSLILFFPLIFPQYLRCLPRSHSSKTIGSAGNFIILISGGEHQYIFRDQWINLLPFLYSFPVSGRERSLCSPTLAAPVKTHDLGNYFTSIAKLVPTHFQLRKFNLVKSMAN